ncbi:YaaA family protein [Agromyces salentinus]|uniref:Peroxide stress protein YaaA n=1 Tax=Agromyces salentinus TaxID=269421 RepID=A0ABN2MWF3_9MICO|nr:peroxide stress protein YaaA [Agromyces salentinus]
MLLLLPPSETKREGGSGAPLDLASLSYPELTDLRSELVDRLIALCADESVALKALKLGPRLVKEVEHDRLLRTSPTMPALDRFTGVLFDALDAETLDDASRRFAADTTFVHSALFGLLGALDPIPAYRLSHDSRVPGVSLRRYWREAISSRISEHAGVVLDLRSEAYADLGPSPARQESLFVRVVTVDAGGQRRALNHFNKQAKGRFTRRFLETRPIIDAIDDLIDWAGSEGFVLGRGAAATATSPLELDLVA